jgi:hypothetical protein
VIRHCRTPRFVIDTILHRPRNWSAAAVLVSTRADESFFRGGEPERRPRHTVVAWPPPAAACYLDRFGQLKN